MPLRRSSRIKQKGVRTRYTAPDTDEDEDSELDYESSSNSKDEEESSYSPSDGENDCICGKPQDNRIMICCDKCNLWYHHNCVKLSKSKVNALSKSNTKWFCPQCKKSQSSQKSKKKKKTKSKTNSKKKNTTNTTNNTNITNRTRRSTKRKRHQIHSSTNNSNTTESENEHENERIDPIHHRKKRRRFNRTSPRNRNKRNSNNNNIANDKDDTDTIRELVGIPLTPQQRALRRFFSDTINEFSEANSTTNRTPITSPLRMRGDFQLPFAPQTEQQTEPAPTETIHTTGTILPYPRIVASPRNRRRFVSTSEGISFHYTCFVF